jgi:hypothetical protein
MLRQTSRSEQCEEPARARMAQGAAAFPETFIVEPEWIVRQPTARASCVLAVCPRVGKYLDSKL